MAIAAQAISQIPRDRADVSAFAADQLKHNMILIRPIKHDQAFHKQRPRCQLHLFAGAGQSIGALAINFDS